MDTEDIFATELAEFMVASTEGLHPQVADLVDQGVRRGRRMRRHARMRSAAAGVSVLAVTVGVAWGVVALAQHPGQTVLTPGDGATSTPASMPASASASGSASASASTPASAEPTASASSVGTMPSVPPAHLKITPTGAEKLLLSMLPPGHITWDPGQKSLSEFGNYFPAGSSKGYQVSFLVAPPDGGGATINDCPTGIFDEGPRPPGSLPHSCRTEPVDGGGYAIVIVTEADQWSFYDYQIDYFRPDGVEVSLTIANGTTKPSHGNPVTVSAATPPITLNRLIAMTESPLWK
jgi:hypothetical protein